MKNKLKILSSSLLEDYKKNISFNILDILEKKSKEEISFEYFKFYNATSSVYSSKIEGVEIELDSFMKHKFLNVSFKPDYTKKADDLLNAYEFMQNNTLTSANVLKVHSILSQNFLSSNQRGFIRKNPMFVLNEDARIEYVACEPSKVKTEWNKLFADVEFLLKNDLSIQEVFYFASMIHLVFFKIHPLQDGNGRTGRLIEKWFLKEKIGRNIFSVELEKNYFQNKPLYYNNIRKIGLEYPELEYSKSLDFLEMTVKFIGS